MSTPFDSDLEAVEDLKWLPWVGQNYSERPNHKRLLIIGESHYCRGDFDWYDRDRGATRQIVADRGGGAKTFMNIPRLLFNAPRPDDSRLWADTAYYNFVQRPMTDKDSRPTWEDFVAGWKVFPQVIQILKQASAYSLVFLRQTASRRPWPTNA